MVSIDDSVIVALKMFSVDSYPNETGGFLVGKYDNNHHAHISDLVQPTSVKSNPYSFERNTDGMKKIWDELYEQGLIYLGEWHTHPSGSCNYSQTDLEAMRSIANCKDVKIRRPILLIASVSKQKINGIHLYHLNNNQLIKCKSR